ncbi:MAG: hypothetical protein JXR95_11195 [Deltaproteobacteria bacterium]|nr:hypothetical protein [Deltaproteobacteria bacterium]
MKAQRLVIRKITLEKVVVDVRYEIHNPHSVALKVLKVDQHLKIGNEQVAEGNLVNEVTVDSKKSSNIDVRLVLPIKSGFKNIGSLILGKELDYSLTSDITMKTFLGKENRSLLREGKIRLPIVPIKNSIKIKNISITSGVLQLDIAVKIPLPEKQRMKSTWADYSYTIENTTIAQGKIKLETDGRKKTQEIIIPIKWPFDKGLLWTGKFLTTGVSSNFKLFFNLGEETEFRIDHTEKVGLSAFKKLF